MTSENKLPAECQVVVVGAGPAGTTAARLLASAGVQTLILEKARPPRVKVCGGGLLGRARPYLPPGLEAVVERDCCQVDFLLHDARGLLFNHRAERDRPLISMVRRDRFDTWLLDQALAAGARLQSGVEALRVTETKAGLSLETTAGPVQAGLVLAADGALARLARRAAWPETRLLAPAIDLELELSGLEDRRLAWVPRFDFGRVEAGYGWVFPKAETLSVGVVSMAPGRIGLEAALERYLAATGLSGQKILSRDAAMIPVSPRLNGPGPAGGRLLILGDAAGLADPITGEGLTGALMSGSLAARTIIDLGPTPAAGREYARRLSKAVAADFKAARRLAKLTYFMPRLRSTLFKHRGARLVELMVRVAMGETNYSRLWRNPAEHLKLWFNF